MILLFYTKVFAMKTQIKQLPKSTGPYPVGTVSYHLIDKTRLEQHVQDPFVLLKDCGHCPWIEKRAKNEFYNVLQEYF